MILLFLGFVLTLILRSKTVSLIHNFFRGEMGVGICPVRHSPIRHVFIPQFESLSASLIYRILCVFSILIITSPLVLHIAETRAPQRICLNH